MRKAVIQQVAIGHHLPRGAFTGDFLMEGWASSSFLRHCDEDQTLLKSKPQICAMGAQSGQFASRFGRRFGKGMTSGGAPCHWNDFDSQVPALPTKSRSLWTAISLAFRDAPATRQAGIILGQIHLADGLRSRCHPDHAGRPDTSREWPSIRSLNTGCPSRRTCA
jgi:hypothetical protein